MIISRSVVRWMRMFQTNVVQKIEARVLYLIIFFSEKHAGYEIMWKNLVESDRPQMTIWLMRIPFWEPKATITRSEYVRSVYWFPTANLVAPTRFSVTLYVRCLSCWLTASAPCVKTWRYGSTHFLLRIHFPVCEVIVIGVMDNASAFTGGILIFYEITNRCSYMQSILFHC